MWCGVVDMSLSWWSLSLCRGPSLCAVIEMERRRKSKKEMARRSLNKSSEECPFLLRMMSTLQRARAERSMIEQKNGLDPNVFPQDWSSTSLSGKANG